MGIPTHHNFDSGLSEGLDAIRGLATSHQYLHIVAYQVLQVRKYVITTSFTSPVNQKITHRRYYW